VGELFQVHEIEGGIGGLEVNLCRKEEKTRKEKYMIMYAFLKSKKKRKSDETQK